MKEWSILSDHVRYVNSDRSETFNNLSIDKLNYRQDIDLYRELQEKESLNAHVNFRGSPDKLKSVRLDAVLIYSGRSFQILGPTDATDEFWTSESLCQVVDKFISSKDLKLLLFLR